MYYHKFRRFALKHAVMESSSGNLTKATRENYIINKKIII